MTSHCTFDFVQVFTWGEIVVKKKTNKQKQLNAKLFESPSICFFSFFFLPIKTEKKKLPSTLQTFMFTLSCGFKNCDPFLKQFQYLVLFFSLLLLFPLSSSPSFSSSSSGNCFLWAVGKQESQMMSSRTVLKGCCLKVSLALVLELASDSNP